MSTTPPRMNGHAPAAVAADGSWIGTSPAPATISTSTVAITMSNSARIVTVEAIVATFDPGITPRASATLAASPPRAGATAFSATPVA